MVMKSERHGEDEEGEDVRRYTGKLIDGRTHKQTKDEEKAMRGKAEDEGSEDKERTANAPTAFNRDEIKKESTDHRTTDVAAAKPDQHTHSHTYTHKHTHTSPSYIDR